MKKIQILLAEDHDTVREGLRLLLNAQEDMEVIGEANDGKTACQRSETLNPDVVIMDVTMAGMNGLQATRKIKELQPATAVVVLTRHSDEAYVQELVRAGVSAYVLKQSDSAELIRAVREAAQGRPYLDRHLAERLTGDYFQKHSPAPLRPTLSQRESDVLRHMARGLSNKDIAAMLDLSVKTIEVHKSNSMKKLGLSGRVDVVRYALLQGWLQDL